MPTYEVTDPTTGRTVELTGDSPPNEQELEAIFAQIGAPATESPFPTGQDFLRSGQEYVGNLAQAVLHPIQTAQGLGNLALGGVQKLIPGTQPQEVYADALGDFVKQRYGSFDAARDTLKRDPVGVMADASMVLSGGAGAVSKLGTVANLPKLTTAGRVAGAAARAVDPLVATTQAARFAGRMPARVADASMRGTAAKAINSLIKPKNRQFSYGRNPGLGIAQEGIVASDLNELAQKAAARQQVIGQQIGMVLNDPRFATQQLNITTALDPIQAALTHAKRNPRTNASLIQRLENLRDDLLGVVVNPDGSTTVTRDLTKMTPPQVFDFKRTVGELTKWTDNLSDDNAVDAALKKVYSSARKALEQAVPGIRESNERYANLLEAANAARNQALIMERRTPIGLFDVIAGTAGAAHGGLDTAVIGVLLSQGAKAMISSPYIRTEMAKWMMRARPTEVEAFLNRVPGLRNEMVRFGLLAGTGQQRITGDTTGPNRTLQP